MFLFRVQEPITYLPTTPFFQESLLFSGFLDPKNRSTPIFHIFKVVYEILAILYAYLVHNEAKMSYFEYPIT